MKKSLIETNSYLKDPAECKLLMRRSLVSSFAIEGIYLKDETAGSIKEAQQTFTARKQPVPLQRLRVGHSGRSWDEVIIT